MPAVFFCTMEDIPDPPGAKKPKNEMKVIFSCEGSVVSGFDIKQMICHLLAIATDRLSYPDGKSVLFLYLLYNPTALKMEPEVKQEVLDIYQGTCWSALHYDFKTMFGHVVDYIASIKKHRATEAEIMHIKNSFEFVLCDQENYCKYI
jgi:hypothetical protein